MNKMDTPNNKILLVDDEQDILEFFGYNLSREGFQLFTAANGEEAMEIARKEKPDLIVLDIMMPELDGIETCKSIKALPECSKSIVLFLTAGSSRFARESMEAAQADDFMLKPLRPKMFLDKVQSVLLQFGKVPSPTQGAFLLRHPNFTLNRKTLEFTNRSRFVKLRRTEFEILWLLASNPGQIYSSGTIKSSISQYEDPELIKVKKCIVRIREKIGADYIKTVKGFGYKFDEAPATAH